MQTRHQFHNLQRKRESRTRSLARDDLPIHHSTLIDIFPASTRNLVFDTGVTGDLCLFAAFQPFSLASIRNAGDDGQSACAYQTNVLAGIAVFANEILHARVGGEGLGTLEATGKNQDVGIRGRREGCAVGDDFDTTRASAWLRNELVDGCLSLQGYIC
jgi:hypothetical protein